MSIAPTLYDYHGQMISIKEGAELAYITPEALRQRLKKVGGDMMAAIDGVKPSQVVAKATDEILDILGINKDKSLPELPEEEDTADIGATETNTDIEISNAETASVPAMGAADKHELRILNRAIKALKAVEFIELDDDSNVLLDDALQRLRRIRRELFDECVDWEAMAK